MKGTKAARDIIKPLTNLQIDEFMKKYKINNYIGCYSKDILPTKPKSDESMIINLQDYLDGNGTHWVAIYNSPKFSDIEYFDSFGITPLMWSIITC